MVSLVWLSHMKTTLNLDDEILIRAKQLAAERHMTLTSFVENALREALAPAGRPAFHLKLPTMGGDRPPRVDPSDRSALYDLMEQGDGNES